MKIQIINQIGQFLGGVGKEIWENGKASPSQKAILKSFNISQLLVKC